MSIIDCDRLNGLIGEQAEEIARLTTENKILRDAIGNHADSYANGLAEGRRLERERCAEMISHIDKIAGPLLAAAIRGEQSTADAVVKLQPGEPDPRD